MPCGESPFLIGNWLLNSMKGYSNKTRTRLKIIGATATTIFSLASVFTGTYAWFAFGNSVTATGMQLSVEVTGSASLTNLDLIKFDYDYDTIGNMKVYDYLDPSTGEVNRYYFNGAYNSGAGSFGYDDNGTFVPIESVMNVYDPVDRIIRGGDLVGLNCNAIYAATFSSNINTAYLQLFADRLLDKVPEENQILLSDCIDIDVYYENDLNFSDDNYSDSSTYAVGDFVIHNSFLYRCETAVESAEAFDSNKWLQIPQYSTSSTYAVNSCVFYSGAIYENSTAVATAESFSKAKWHLVENYSTSSSYALDAFVIHNGRPYKCVTAINSGETFNANKWNAFLCERIYYPSYKTSGLTSQEEIYYKFSYISSLEASHNNFYSSNPKPNNIELARDQVMEFADLNDLHTIYINVNYAPSQADVYIREIYNTIRAIYDFIFDFQFTERPEVGA